MESLFTLVADYLARQSWQVAVVFPLVAVACYALRKASAHWRYLLWLIVLAKCLTPGLVSVPVPVWLDRAAGRGRPDILSSVAAMPQPNETRLPSAAALADPETATTVAAPVATVTKTSQREVMGAAESGAANAISVRNTNLSVWFAAAWCSGVAIFITYVSIKAWTTNHRLRLTKLAADPQIAPKVAALAKRLGIRTVPAVYMVDAIAQPFVWGWLRGSIYVPRQFVATGIGDQQEAILAHELAHVARWDVAANLVQIVVQALFFFHPLVWWANWQIRRERENCCDETVIAGLGADPKRYAQAIVDTLVAEYQAKQTVPSLAVAGRLNNIEQRIQTILSPNRRFRRRPSPTAVATAVLAAAFALPTAFVLTAHAGSPDSGSAGASTRASSPPNDDAAKDRSESVTPKGRNPSGKTSPKDPEGDKKPSKALAYTGQVTDKLTGNPIVGASVTVLRRVSSRTGRFPEWRKLGETKHQTDADGRYTFTVPPEQAADSHLYIEITATHPDYVRFYGGYSFDMLRQNEKLGERPFFENLALEPAGKVSGTVETPDGKPAKGVMVKGVSSPARDDPNSFSWEDTTTNEEGFFQLNLSKRGEAVFWLLPNDYAPSTHVLHAKRGDLGHFVLEKGMVLRGRVVDADGKPLKNVWVNAEIRGGPAKQKIDNSLFDHLARSALSDDKGEFSMAPLPAGDYSLIMADKPRSGSGDVHPLPAVFINQEITLDQDRSAKPIEVRATAHVLIAGQYFDSSGKPTSGFAPMLSAHGPSSQAWFWDTAQIDEHGKFTVKSPKGFVATLNIVDNEHHSIKTRASKHGPLNNGSTLDLGVLDRDVNDVAIIRYVAPILLVKATEEDGTPISKLRPSIRYPFNPIRDSSRLGYVAFEHQDDGRWRTSQLLPDEQFTITVDAEGYESKPENLKLPEGAVKELDIRLKKTSKPRTSTN
ncbi:MAG: M56 family metallopeptidase [Thermoguttaceae bacterium]